MPRAGADGPCQGPAISYVDIAVAPWFLRLSRVLHPYRGWPRAGSGSRLGRWLDALEADEAVRNTTSDDGLYLDSYERYAGMHPRSSRLADHQWLI